MFLRSEDEAPAGGRAAPLAAMWSLSVGWYRGRLESDFRPMAVEQLQRLLDDAGLTGDFWQLS